MKILGIGFLSESSACVLKDGKISSALSEERLNRKKLWYGFPEESIKKALEISKLKLSEIDLITTHGLLPSPPSKKIFLEKKMKVQNSDLKKSTKTYLLEFLDKRYSHELFVYNERTPKMFSTIKSLKKKIQIYPHHLCHASTAYYGSGWKFCNVITADGWGEDGSHSFYECKRGINPNKSLIKISHSNTIDSLGYFYGSITKALGYIPHRHEGKILGLAAYKKNPKSLNILSQMIDFNEKKFSFEGKIENGLYIPDFDNPYLLSLTRKYSSKDIAASAQITLEKVFIKHINCLKPNTQLAVAGGVFANVKLNQIISENKNIKSLYIFPNMGDGGLSIGSAWLAYHQYTGKYPKVLKNMYLGNQVKSSNAELLATELGLKVEKHKLINKKIAELLSKKKIVARCSGRMEFGPRALGNRSIFFHAQDQKVNKWLNKKLGRSEFMPFAPITRTENSELFSKALKKSKISSQFMTITTDCNIEMINNYPASVHVDKTARPQIVSKDTSPDIYEILREYENLTNLKCLINTSFNMHEEPIVSNENDAIRAYLSSNIDYLVINDLLIWI